MGVSDSATGRTGASTAVVVMGVAGAGKTTLAAAVAERLRAVFVEADDLHSQIAKQQMAGGVPLTDDDRWPWLKRVARRVSDVLAEGDPVVVSCSALRRSYREALARESGTALLFVHVHGSEAELAARIGARQGHFMPSSMLASQLATLEPLAADELGIVVPLSATIEVSAARVAQFIMNRAEGRHESE